LGYIQRTVVGSPEYFKKHPIPVHPRELAEHNCMHFTHYLRADEWTFQEEGRSISVRVRGRMRANNQEALLDAVLTGAGLAVLPMWLVRHMVGEGRLTRVLGGFERPRTPVHAVLPNRGPPPSKVRAFIEFLSARYKELGILSPEGLGSES
jgi:DNA-binding transcriptional LysR family regulator